MAGDLPLEVKLVRFIRLFDFGMRGYSLTRTMAEPVKGGVMVAFNAYAHGMVHPRNEFEEEFSEVTNFINRPTVLLYTTPPIARIVAALGARVTSIGSIGSSMLLGCSTEENMRADAATPIDVRFSDITTMSHDTLLTSKPPTIAPSLGASMWEKV